MKYQKCLENGVKVFILFLLKEKVPDDYFAPVYRTMDELFNAIDSYIQEQNNGMEYN